MEENHYLYKVFYKKHTIILKQQDHYGKYIKLRQQYPKFRYVDYSYQIINNELVLKFTFDISGVYTFSPQLKLQHRSFYKLNDLTEGVMRRLPSKSLFCLFTGGDKPGGVTGPPPLDCNGDMTPRHPSCSFDHFPD